MVFKLDLAAAGLKKPTIPLSIIPTIPQIPAKVPAPVPSAGTPSDQVHNAPSPAPSSTTQKPVPLIRRPVLPSKRQNAPKSTLHTSRALVLYHRRRRRTQAELLKEAWANLPFFMQQQRTPLLLEYGSRMDHNGVRRSKRIAKRLAIQR
jgi:hypothetical protein